MKKYEFSRAALHFSWTVPATILMAHLKVDTALMGMLLLVSSTIILALDAFRVLLWSYVELPATPYEHALKIILEEFHRRTPFRKKEQREFTAMVWFCAGLSMVYLLLPIQEAYMCLMILATGDPAARIIGLFAGGKKIYKNKSISGMIGFVVVSFAMLSFGNIVAHQSGYYQISAHLLLVQFLACFAAAIAELFSGKYDNMLIPVSAGVVIRLLL